MLKLWRCPTCGREWQTVADDVGRHYPLTPRRGRDGEALVCRGNPKLVAPFRMASAPEDDWMVRDDEPA